MNVKPEIINQTEVYEKKKINFYFKMRALPIFLILLVIFQRLTNFSPEVSISLMVSAFFSSLTCGHYTLTKTACSLAPYSVPCRYQPITQLEQVPFPEQRIHLLIISKAPSTESECCQISFMLFLQDSLDDIQAQLKTG